MVGLQRMRWRVGLIVAASVVIAAMGITPFLKPLPNSCIMTYMYPTYIPIPGPPEVRSDKYGLYLYHEGWRKIDFQLHLRKLSGVPVLFIPGNGGSYKQVRSVAAESDRAYNGGPQEESFYLEASFTAEEAGVDAHGGGQMGTAQFHMGELLANTDVQGQYPNHLDWFAVDLEGEHSAMDGRILEEHTDYVVLAIHRILDQYKESSEARSKQIKETGEVLPSSIILVGHSMGGFVARAAVVHPKLRAGAVKTIFTLSSPHSSPPIALQPSLGHFFSRVNEAWRRGYRTSRVRSALSKSSSKAFLSDVVVISIFGGVHDYQVRSRMASLEGIVPPTNGLTIGAPEMLNVWLSSEHQSILWCNQLVVQVAHTLLHLVDRTSGQPFESAQIRLALSVTKLRSALAQVFGLQPSVNSNELDSLHHLPLETQVGIGQKKEFFARKTLQAQDDDVLQEEAELAARHDSVLLDVRDRQRNGQFFCQNSNKWETQSQEKDLYIRTSTVTVLAMDGRRRWLDIEKLGADGKDHFILVTNLVPCSGVRVHLWREKERTNQKGDGAASHRTVEVTTKMVRIPAGPAPRQIEPGGQTEQAPPSGLLLLSPNELHGFRFITISVAPRPTVSGRPPPATSMAVGQFFSPKDGSHKVHSSWLLSSIYKKREIAMAEDHPLAINLSIPLSLGMVPVVLEVKTSSCGISDSLMRQSGDSEHAIAGFCKLRCFPPLALAWDTHAGLEIFLNLQNETIVLDSSPATLSSYGPKKSTLLLLVDPHCAYTVRMEISLFKAANRFLLMYALQIAGIAVAIIFFALMQQARAAELHLPLPSVLACIDMNLKLPLPFMSLAMGPLLLFSCCSLNWGQPGPPIGSVVIVSLICYVLANGVIALLAVTTLLVFQTAAFLQVFVKIRWQTWLNTYNSNTTHRFMSHFSKCSNFQIMRTLRGKPRLAVGMISSLLIFFVHPGVGLIILLCYHAWNCYISLCRYRHKKGMAEINNKKCFEELQDQKEPYSEPSSNEHKRCYTDVQLELFKVQQGLLLLHLTSAAMLVPSLIAWAQRPSIDKNMPWFYDSVFTFGIIIHGLYEGHPDTTMSILSLPIVSRLASTGLSLIYGVAGLYCYFSGVVFSPYLSFYALAGVGFLTTSLRLRDKFRKKGEPVTKRCHYHKHS